MPTKQSPMWRVDAYGGFVAKFLSSKAKQSPPRELGMACFDLAQHREERGSP